MKASDLREPFLRFVAPTDSASIEEGGDGGSGELALSRWRVSASQAEIAEQLELIAQVFQYPSAPRSVLFEAANRIRSGKVRARVSKRVMAAMVKGKE